MVRAQRRTWIARGNSLTISTRCGVVWMRRPTGAINRGNNKGISKGNNRVSNRDNSRVNKVRKDKRANKDLKVGSRAASNKVTSSLVVRKMVATSLTATGSVRDPTAML